MPYLESLGAGRWFGVFPVSGGNGYWGKEAKQWVPHPSTHPLHAMPSLCVEPGAGSFPLLAPAHSSSFSPQTPAPPCLQTPQLRAQAQSPLCHLHSEEPASHLSPSLPMEVTVPGTALPHFWDLSEPGEFITT